MSRRTERIGEQLREAIAEVLRREVSDPRVASVTVTHVDVAPDLSHAVVAWSALDVRGKLDLDAVGEGLQSAAPFVRRRLARSLTLRRMPELRFQRDPSIERGSDMLELLRRLNEGPAAGETPDPDSERESDG